jgi:hypothetical protein
MTPEPRDELDRALAAGLGGLASDADDTDAVLSSMRPRLQRARTRRRLARAAVVLGAFIVMGSAAFALTGPDADKVKVAVPSTTRPAAVASTSTTRAATTTVAPPTTHTTTVTTAPPTPPAPHPTVPARGGTPPPATVPSPTTTTIAPSDLRTYHSDGGTMTVRYSHGKLALVSYRAASGYTAEVHRNQPDDVEVRFSGPDERRIRIRVEQGDLSEEIE